LPSGHFRELQNVDAGHGIQSSEKMKKNIMNQNLSLKQIIQDQHFMNVSG
jgi:hypothetical protein